MNKFLLRMTAVFEDESPMMLQDYISSINDELNQKDVITIQEYWRDELGADKVFIDFIYKLGVDSE